MIHVSMTEAEVTYHYEVATRRRAGTRALMAAHRQDWAALEMAEVNDACDSRSRLLQALVPAITAAANERVARQGGSLEAAFRALLGVANLAIR